MARYKKHTVRQGDTMQAISQSTTGNVNNWIKIVEYNQLVYPYIVDTPNEKMANVEHLVTIGDQLIIPIETSLLDINPTDLNRRDRDFVLSLALGRDLNMTADENYYKNKGTSDEILALSADGKGDLSTVQGVDNLKQAINAKLLTAKGSLLLHPEYGSDLHKMFDKVTTEQAKLIEIEVCRVVATDKRINSIFLDSYTLEEDTYKGVFTVEIQSFEEAFNFVIQGDTNGTIILT